MDDAVAVAFVAVGVAVGEDIGALVENLALSPQAHAHVVARLELATVDKKQRARAVAGVLANVAVALDRLELAWRS